MRARWTLVLALAALAAGCSDDGDEPAVIERVSGNDQTAGQGEQLAAPLVVRVRNSQGGAVQGVTVRWRVASGGGLVNPSSVTDEDGEASTTFRLGMQTGQDQIAQAVLAGVDGSPIDFDAQLAVTPPPGGGGADPE